MCIEDNIETRGRMTLCKSCGNSFKILGDQKKKDWWNGDQRCPYCNEPYCSKPATERKLFVLQDEYFANDKDIDILNEISGILIVYAESLLKKFFQQHLTQEGKLEYFSSNAVSFVIEEMLRRDVVIKHSWAGMLTRKIRQAIFNKHEKLQEDLSINWEFQDHHEPEYKDRKERSMLDEIEEKEAKNEIFELCKCILIEDFYSSSEYDNFIRIIALHKYLTRSERIADKIFTDKAFHKRGKEAYLKTLNTLYTHLKDI